MAHSAKPPRDQVQQNSSRGVVNYSGQMRAIDVKFSPGWTAIQVTGYSVKENQANTSRTPNNTIWLLRNQSFVQRGIRLS